MSRLVIVTALFLCVFHNALAEKYAFSQPVGPGGGDSFSLNGDGAITAIRVWEQYNSVITGFQVRYGPTWSPIIGAESGDAKEMELYKDEGIIQISGKFNSVITSLVFVTKKGRTLQAGQPSGTSFNMYAPSKDTELVLISGQTRGPNRITYFGAHWGIPEYYI
ncbi:zymogen granule membrane protein 16-like [Hippocampus zosterae]|uniref:zymogen granule membrane protein 16-like n=1 Tax=Hippocampus zosterae TaxID=109293 RepID=UPI00223CAD85|nr:zymogen granule membrane protein 16-like [Hippocampus zosterae]XP_051927532.1 zymogen granule membrane protein 16-like [Hippocampus zosterae]